MRNEQNEDEAMMRDIGRTLRAPLPMNGAFDDRVMSAVRALPAHNRFGLWSRLTTPRRRTVTVIPLSWGLLAASVALFALLGAAHAYTDLHRAAKPMMTALMQPKKASPAQPVQFVLVAPDAKKVAVVGDFNGWDATHAQYQAQHRGGGVWSVTAAVPAGHHHYSFIVDDSVWVADPYAPRVMGNDFGVASSAIVVEEQ